MISSWKKIPKKQKEEVQEITNKLYIKLSKENVMLLYVNKIQRKAAQQMKKFSMFSLAESFFYILVNDQHYLIIFLLVLYILPLFPLMLPPVSLPFQTIFNVVGLGSVLQEKAIKIIHFYILNLNFSKANSILQNVLKASINLHST